MAKHLGVQSAVGAAPSFIHAYTGHGVVESPLSLPWQRRIVARFEFPQGE
ncbi:Phage cell wall peptidase, NlpC/P60 family [Sulfitobacter noctilucae]|nr:Phage cell wall peptidase, NlpC/P60 family [Sulfitobacter noctilucae]